jgi:3-oxoadipate enol-lactonase
MPNEHYTTGKALANGTQFSYDIIGIGHPLVLVHAGVADRHMWDEQVSAFAKHYQVIRYDLRGYGNTPMVAGTFSHHHDLHELLTYLGIKRAYFLGCSMGGATIIDFALEYPQMVGALILVTSALSGFEYNDDEAPEELGEHRTAVERGDIARAAELEARYWVVGTHRKPGQVDSAILKRISEMNRIALPNQLSELGSEQALEPPAIHRLNEIHVPTLVITGDLDDPNIVEIGDILATQIADAQKVVISGTAHFPSMERPDEFNQLVLDFLARL